MFGTDLTPNAHVNDARSTEISPLIATIKSANANASSNCSCLCLRLDRHEAKSCSKTAGGSFEDSGGGRVHWLRLSNGPCTRSLGLLQRLGACATIAARWLRRIFGDDFFRDVLVVSFYNLPQPVREERFQQIAKLPTLEFMYLTNLKLLWQMVSVFVAFRIRISKCFHTSLACISSILLVQN